MSGLAKNNNFAGIYWNLIKGGNACSPEKEEQKQLGFYSNILIYLTK